MGVLLFKILARLFHFTTLGKTIYYITILLLLILHWIKLIYQEEGEQTGLEASCEALLQLNIQHTDLLQNIQINMHKLRSLSKNVRTAQNLIKIECDRLKKVAKCMYFLLEE